MDGTGKNAEASVDGQFARLTDVQTPKILVLWCWESLSGEQRSWADVRYLEQARHG